MPIANCKDCKHYTDTNSILGLCRRYPQYQNRSPQEWCGEFSARAVADLPPNEGDFLKRKGRPPKQPIIEFKVDQ